MALTTPGFWNLLTKQNKGIKPYNMMTQNPYANINPAARMIKPTVRKKPRPMYRGV
jgi:hypothetical protein